MALPARRQPLPQRRRRRFPLRRLLHPARRRRRHRAPRYPRLPLYSPPPPRGRQWQAAAARPAPSLAARSGVISAAAPRATWCPPPAQWALKGRVAARPHPPPSLSPPPSPPAAPPMGEAAAAAEGRARRRLPWQRPPRQRAAPSAGEAGTGPRPSAAAAGRPPPRSRSRSPPGRAGSRFSRKSLTPSSCSSPRPAHA